MSHTQHEIKIVIYTPRSDDTFCADVYFDGKRIKLLDTPPKQTIIEAYEGALKYLSGAMVTYGEGFSIITDMLEKSVDEQDEKLSWTSVDTSIE